MLDILEEHFEELDFLWQQREGVIFAPDWNLAELAELEERAEAHLDGLRLAEGHAVEIARPALGAEEKGAATAAALTLMALGDAALETEVVAALAGDAKEARDGLRIGLRHSDISRVADRLGGLALSGDSAVRAMAADVLAFHRRAVPRGFADLLASSDPSVRRLACAAAGRFGGPWSIDHLQDALEGDEPRLQRVALETSALIGVPNLVAICRRAATRCPSPSPMALAFLGVIGETGDLAILQAALSSDDLAGPALAGLGALGKIAAIPVLIESMKEPKRAHAAGAAFARITGATDIEADAVCPRPAELPEEERDFLDDTCPPDPARALALWEKIKGCFKPEGRWQAGQEVPRIAPGGAFDALPLEIRRDVYLAARAKDPQATPDLELERRAELQSKLRSE